jgi:deazaflavin-dependent oxidoreductase (nitroreductase family)
MDVRGWVEKEVGGRIFGLHDRIYQKTQGRIGHKIPGVPPSLLLHTTGAKTDQPRTNSLTYARDGDAYLIVASNGGSDRYPGWYHNLRARPGAEINVGPKRFGVSWRQVTPPIPITSGCGRSSTRTTGTCTTATSARHRGRFRSSS